MLNSTSNLCPNLAKRVYQDLGTPGLNLWRELGGTQSSVSHENCTQDRCRANDAGVADNSEASHVEPSCRCTLVGPRMHEVTSIIDDNLIPVVAVDETGENCQLVVDAYKPGLDFAVISHV